MLYLLLLLLLLVENTEQSCPQLQGGLPLEAAAVLGNEAFSLASLCRVSLPSTTQMRFDAEPMECFQRRGHWATSTFPQGGCPSRASLQGHVSVKATSKNDWSQSTPRHQPKEGRNVAKTLRNTSGEALTQGLIGFALLTAYILALSPGEWTFLILALTKVSTGTQLLGHILV